MKPLETFLAELAESLPEGMGSEASGARLEVSSAELGVPIELRIGGGGTLFASAPRGRQVTGFDAPLGRLHVWLTRGER
jgi:hypothetical protein